MFSHPTWSLVLYVFTPYLVSSFESRIECLRRVLHLGDEYAAAALESAEDLEVQDLLPGGAGQRDGADPRLGRAGDVQQPHLADQLLQHAEGTKETVYLTTHSTHFIYRYIASDIW